MYQTNKNVSWCRQLTVAAIAALIIGCGGFQERTSGISEETMLVVQADDLIGTMISVGEQFSLVVAQDNLTPSTLGVGGAADRELQNLDVVMLKVSTGNQLVEVRRGTKVLFSQNMHFGTGQTRTVRVRE